MRAKGTKLVRWMKNFLKILSDAPVAELDVTDPRKMIPEEDYFDLLEVTERSQTERAEGERLLNERTGQLQKQLRYEARQAI